MDFAEGFAVDLVLVFFAGCFLIPEILPLVVFLAVDLFTDDLVAAVLDLAAAGFFAGDFGELFEVLAVFEPDFALEAGFLLGFFASGI